MKFVVDGTVSSVDGRRWVQQMRLAHESRLSQRYGLDQDGLLLPLSAARKALDAYHRERFGALGVGSAGRWLRSQGRDMSLSFSINPDRVDMETALSELRHALGVSVSLHAETHTAYAIVKNRDDTLLNVAHEPWLNKVHVHFANPPTTGFGVPRYFQVPPAPLTLNAHWSFNDIFVDGTGQKLGLLDAVAAECQLFDEHEAFSQSPGVRYQDPTPRSCSDDGDCKPCDAGGLSGVCRNNRCVATHSTAAAGAMLSYQTCGNAAHDYCSDANQPSGCTSSLPQYAECDGLYGGDFMASRAELFFANATANTNQGDRAAAYDWLLAEGVQIVAEPYRLGSLNTGETSSQDVLQDNYTRYDNMVFVRSAANGQNLTTCNGLNAICVGGHTSPDVTSAASNTGTNVNGTPTGAPTIQSALNMRNPGLFVVSPGSSWQNPPPPMASGLERPYEVSRPNISALSTQVWLPSVGTLSEHPLWKWGRYGGNSFAGPAVAALLALYNDYCGRTNYDSRQLRAELFASGYRGIGIEERYDATTAQIANRTPGQPLQPQDPDVCKGPPFNAPNSPTTAGYFRFPTADSRFDCDYGQGVGPANAAALRWLCPQPTSGSGTGSGPAQTDTDGQASAVYGDFAPVGRDPRDSVVALKGPSALTDASGAPLEFSPWKDALRVQVEGQGLAQLTAIHGMVPKSGSRLLSSASSARVLARPLAGSFPQNEPIRATLVYDSCPNGGVRDNAVINNVDIALCGIRADNGNRECIAVSESLDDNVEGFDVRLPRAYSSLSTLLIWNTPLHACPEKDGSIPSTASEPIGWMVVTWP